MNRVMQATINLLPASKCVQFVQAHNLVTQLLHFYKKNTSVEDHKHTNDFAKFIDINLSINRKAESVD